MTCGRFQVDERCGIIAIVDTKHSSFPGGPGLHGDEPFVVAHWYGFRQDCDGGFLGWSISRELSTAAHAAAEALNNAVLAHETQAKEGNP